MIIETPEALRALLERSKTIAVVGASNKPDRPSYGVFAYLRAHGYDARPVNPTLDHVDGVGAFASLQDFAQELGPPDIVDVFRRPNEALEATEHAIAVGAKAVWYQLGVVNEEAIAKADAAGLDVVVDLCIKIEHRALVDATNH